MEASTRDSADWCAIILLGFFPAPKALAPHRVVVVVVAAASPGGAEDRPHVSHTRHIVLFDAKERIGPE